MKTDLVKIPIVRWLPAVMVMFLAACGGGGYGGGGGGSSSGTITTYTATLTGTAEVPLNYSAATGSGTVTVDSSTMVLTATVTTSGIAGTAAHIHEGAVGISGSIIFPLSEAPAGSGKWSTTVTLTNAQLTELRAGRYYINVHSALYPAGEIRGQILSQGTSY
ncbi:MAG: CHRD domain-containing protein [Burkholderiales bacterium]|nr:CHRD domain-containing protein [Burkholderiales bacterium]